MHRSRRLLVILLTGIFCSSMALGSAGAQEHGKGKGKEKEGPKADSAEPGKEKGKGSGKEKAKKRHHQSGPQLVGEKLKSNGHHVIHKNGKHTVAVDVKDGKIAGMSVKHSEKGDVPVKKYKSKKKMASLEGPQSPAVPADEYLGTTWIGYAYIDEDGNEEIYWFPYDMILDGDTGAIEYVPA